MHVICGVRKALLLKQRIILLTLTTSSSTSDGLNEDERMELITKSWNSLHAIMTEQYGEFAHFFQVTNEGNGVLHIAIAGLPFVYWKRIVRWWNVVNGSQLISIGKMHGSRESIAGYLMTQYLANQKCTKVYFRSSKNWICDKFSSYWKMLRNSSRDWTNGIRTEWGTWYYPVNKEQLVINYKKWVEYLVLTGKALEYVPSRYDFNRSLREYE